MIRVSLCQRNKARGILTWYARIFDTETKEVRYESLGTRKKTEATDLMLAKQAAGDYAAKSQNSMKLEDAFELYLKDCESRGSNPQSLATLRRALDTIKGLFTKPIAEITKKDLFEEFSKSAIDYKPTTYNNTKTTIKTAFKFAKDVLEVIEVNPAESIKSRRNPSKEKDFWTLEQIDCILWKTNDSRLRLIFSLMAFAGLRIHEALKLRREDIKDGFLVVVGKGQKFAKIPISSRLLSEIEMSKWDFDFTGINKWHVSHSLKKIAKDALGNSFSGSANPHRFRHSFASNMIRAGVGVKSVQKLMRHANIQTTLNIYSHLIEDDLTQDIEKMFKKP